MGEKPGLSTSPTGFQLSRLPIWQKSLSIHGSSNCRFFASRKNINPVKTDR
jgi:hypothetical protein